MTAARHQGSAATAVGTADPPAALTIRVSSGVGSGLTRLAAFDAALRSAGVGDFNLIRLSSVIPPFSVVLNVDADQQMRGGHGNLLYCVYAESYCSSAGEQAWAGVAWSRREHSGDGLFVEHQSTSHAGLDRDLGDSLDELSSGRGGGFVEAGRRVVSVSCVDRPACAVVVATYRNISWSDDDR